MEAERKIRKIGNSLGVHLPSNFVKAMELEDGDTVYMKYEKDKIIISKAGLDNEEVFKNKVIKILDEYLTEHEKK